MLDRFTAKQGAGDAEGLDIPVYPVKGYSITVPMIDDALAPHRNR